MQAPVKKLDAGTGAPINLQKLTSHSRAGTGILEYWNKHQPAKLQSNIKRKDKFN